MRLVEVLALLFSGWVFGDTIELGAAVAVVRVRQRRARRHVQGALIHQVPDELEQP